VGSLVSAVSTFEAYGHGLDFIGWQEKSGSSFARMPTSQNRDMGHPILGSGSDVGHPSHPPRIQLED